MAEQTTQTDVVPKADFEKVQAQATEATRGLESLKAQLLDPNYLEFLEQKNAGVKKPAEASNKAINLNNMSLDDLQKLIADSSMQAVKAALNPVVGRLNEVQAKLELEDVKERHADFEKFSDQVASILERSPNELTIEQAYLIAKAGTEHAPETTDEKKPEAKKEAPKGGERPGTVFPLDGDTGTAFKNPSQAGQAAWSEVSKKFGLTGDTI